MSSEISPGSEKMDISDTSNSSQSYESSSQVLRLANPTNEENSNVGRLDNDTTTTAQSKTVPVTQSATDSHPLMYSPTSPVSPDYPDLIPQKPKNKNHAKHNFNPKAHSSTNELEKSNGDSDNLDFEIPDVDEYNEKLPDFPESPSALKKSLNFEMPVEFTHADLSDTENDKSVYEAHLSSNLQNVALTMNEKEGNLNFLAHGRRSNKLRRIKVIHTETNSDSEVSSLESISESLKSENVFAGSGDATQVDDLEESKDISIESESPVESIEPLSADEERKHARHWQRMVLPGGEQRTIDMRVIEPYKRVMSHGGYLRAGGHTALVVFSACFLPDRSRVDYEYVMDNLFLYVLWTLERLVTDDYVLIYLHGGATRLPSFGWLKRCYHMVGRRLRKNLVHLYLVHPTLWIKTMLFMAKPFISSKFYRKITYVGSLKELYNRVPLEANAIPDKVKAYDSFHYGS